MNEPAATACGHDFKAAMLPEATEFYRAEASGLGDCRGGIAVAALMDRLMRDSERAIEDEQTSAPDGLDVALARRKPVRRQVGRVAFVAVIVIVALVAVFRGALPVPAVQPAPAITQVTTLVEVASNVSYGTVTLNGERLRSALPGDSLPVRANLAMGPNLITLDAPPFLPVSCGVSGTPGTPVVAPASIGRCALTFDRDGSAVAHTVINVLLTGVDLPSTELAGAERVVADRLAHISVDQAIVPVGQYYATGAHGPNDITSRKATESLRATVSVVPVPNSDDTFPSDAGATLDRCLQLGCPLPLNDPVSIPAHGWVIGDAVALDW